MCWNRSEASCTQVGSIRGLWAPHRTTARVEKEFGAISTLFRPFCPPRPLCPVISPPLLLSVSIYYCVGLGGSSEQGVRSGVLPPIALGMVGTPTRGNRTEAHVATLHMCSLLLIDGSCVTGQAGAGRVGEARCHTQWPSHACARLNSRCPIPAVLGTK